ncbi:MAG: transporter substrate-binding domain-containing protein [Burkholderiaceae bacterium]
MNKLSLVFATALVLSASLANAQTLRIATEGAYPPFNTKSADGQLGGFDVDIAKALCAEMKRECEIVAQDWDGIIPGLVNKKYDAIVASMSITPERKQTIDFTDRYYSNYISVIAPKKSGLAMDDLASKTVGAQRSTIAATWAEDEFGRRGDVKLYDTQTAAYADLEAGRIDALVSDYLPVLDWLKDKPAYDFIGSKIDINDQIGIGLRQGEGSLKESFNQALKTIRSNGTYQKINDKYFSVDIY